jgi:hypothetical protein
MLLPIIYFLFRLLTFISVEYSVPSSTGLMATRLVSNTDLHTKHPSMQYSSSAIDFNTPH